MASETTKRPSRIVCAPPARTANHSPHEPNLGHSDTTEVRPTDWGTEIGPSWRTASTSPRCGRDRVEGSRRRCGSSRAVVAGVDTPSQSGFRIASRQLIRRGSSVGNASSRQLSAFALALRSVRCSGVATRSRVLFWTVLNSRREYHAARSSTGGALDARTQLAHRDWKCLLANGENP